MSELTPEQLREIADENLSYLEGLVSSNDEDYKRFDDIKNHIDGLRETVNDQSAKIARLESALASRGGKVDAEAIMAVLPAEAIAVVVVFAINDHIKHPGPYCIDEIVGACKKISVDDLNAALPEATETTDED